MARRDYGKIAENVAMLGAHSSGVAVPIAPGMALFRALRGRSAPDEDRAFVERLLDGIESWCRVPERQQRIDELGGLSASWRDQLKNRLGETPVPERQMAIELFAQELFTPLIDSPALRQRSELLVSELVDALPELIVGAGDRDSGLAALRAATGADIAQVESLLTTHLDAAERSAGDRALVAAYLARLAGRLDVDNWILRDGATEPAHLSSIQQEITVRDEGQQRQVAVDDLADRSERLVVLGGPGAGKSWSVRRAAIRAARTALEALDAGVGVEQVELPLYASCAEVLTPSDQS